MTTVAIVGCGKAKRDEPSPARELYTSNYFGLKAKAAREIADEWGVASAEHGFVEPDTVLDPYDTSIDDVETGFDGWGFDVLERVVELHDPDRIVLFAGKGYRNPIVAAAPWVGFDFEKIDSPFEWTSGIGEQQALLSELGDLEEAIRKDRELKTDGGSEMVDVVSRGGGGSQRNSVHTDPECHRLQFASNSIKKPREDVDDDRICSFCSGEHEAHQPGHNPNDTRQKLLDMDPEELGLSPMVDRGDAEVADAE